MKNTITTIYLIASGALLVAIGGTLLLTPHAFHGGNGIALGDNPNLLSELRAPGGLLLSCGVFILLGAARHSLRTMAVQMSVLVYSSFGVARVVSAVLDGIPSAGIVGAALIELTVALVGLVVLWRGVEPRTADHSVPPPSRDALA